MVLGAIGNLLLIYLDIAFSGLNSPFEEYDYVIIGAGSAGCVLASRLSEDKNVTVLVLEAGQPEMFLTDVPGIAPWFQTTPYTWQYFMEYQPEVCMGKLIII